MTDPQNPAQNPPRWAADPTGRHQYRYWDGAAWTDQVSDNGAVSVDPPVASPTPTPTPAADARPDVESAPAGRLGRSRGRGRRRAHPAAGRSRCAPGPGILGSA